MDTTNGQSKVTNPAQRPVGVGYDATKVAALKTTKSVDPRDAEIAALRAQVARLQEAPKRGLRFQVGAKGGIMILGLQGFPVTLYADQLVSVLEAKDSLAEFMVANWDKLTFADRKGNPAPEKAIRVQEWLANQPNVGRDPLMGLADPPITTDVELPEHGDDEAGDDELK